MRRRIAEDAAQLPNRAMQHIVGHEDVGPHARDEILAGDDLAGVLRETHQHLHHLGLETHDLVAAPEPVDGGLDGPLADLKIARHARVNRV
jgi:hypothetical protein